GVDAVRYYVLHEIPYANDGNLTYDLLIERINSDLANVLGNLVNRTISMANKYFKGNVTNKKVVTSFDEELIKMVNDLSDKVDKKMDTLEVGLAIDEIFEVLRRCNKYIDETMPWVLAKDEKSNEKLETVLYNLLESIRVCATFLKPFLPSTADEIFNQLNSDNKEEKFTVDSKYKNMNAKVLFARIDKEKKLEEIEKIYN
ncbi:MAG: class I tRNA ligase family protein, partial [Bacilli bacterium]